jgi:N-acetyl-gamma-glutamyl-phosphate reductase
MIRAAVIGSTGYAGIELVRLLSQHPDVTLTAYTSTSYVDEPMNTVYPQFGKSLTAPCVAEDWPKLVADNDVLFCALPHGHVAQKLQPEWLEKVRVIDLGADFRLPHAKTYETWYGLEHPQPTLLPQAVYGLTEWNREALASARLVANPGCYPTATLLGLIPLVKAGLIDVNTIVIDAKSGVSGAGRGLGLDRHFNECHESIKAYGLGSHRHTPEIESGLGSLTQEEIPALSFTPHLVPMNRGILSTMYARLNNEASDSESQLTEQIQKVYHTAYENEPFVRLLPDTLLPETRYVKGSNRCDLNFKVDMRTRRIIVVSAIDNLIKGAAGQAIQNMNRLFDLPETNGLGQVPAFI